MSTPSTLPPHHHNYGYSHHQNYQSTGGYRANNSLLNGGSRLGASYFPTPSSNGTSSNSVGLADPPSRPSQNAAQSSRVETKPAAMPASSSTSAALKQNPKKRQRSVEQRGVDWKKFYANGLPKEVIVIDDSPTPDPSASVLSNTQAARSVAAGNNRHAAKKRRTDDVGPYDPVYHLEQSYSNNVSPEYKDSTGSASTDRTTSAIHTTAATSLGSHSSNGQNGYEVAAQAGTKRKRQTTRLQTTNEAKRKELEVNGDAFTNYKPPPKPPIKAPDVQVKQVPDVSSSSALRKQPSNIVPELIHEKHQGRRRRRPLYRCSRHGSHRKM